MTGKFYLYNIVVATSKMCLFLVSFCFSFLFFSTRASRSMSLKVVVVVVGGGGGVLLVGTH